MSGKHTTQEQVSRYMNSRQSIDSQSKAAAKAGFSERTGWRIEKQEHQRGVERHWRTRKDPLEAVWRALKSPETNNYPQQNRKFLALNSY